VSGRHLKEKECTIQINWNASRNTMLIGPSNLDEKSNEEKYTISGLVTIANQKLVFSERIFVEALKLKLIQAIYLHGMK